MRSLVKRLIKNFLKKRNYLLISYRDLDSILPARRIKRILTEYNIDCIIDAGANVGQYGFFLRKQVEYSGYIFSFEPDPSAFKTLQDNSATDDRWMTFNFGLAEKWGVLPFNLMKTSKLNSFLAPGFPNTGNSANRAVQSTIDVSVNRLDAIIPELKEKYAFRRIFLKMDTQGYDLNVFSGAKQCLHLIYAIQSEISMMPIYKNMPSFEDSMKEFGEAGFEVSGIYSLSEERFPHAIEFDCILLPRLESMAKS